MKDICYLVFNKRGVLGLKKNPPQLDRGEFAVRLKVDIPDTYFATAYPIVELTVPESAVIAPVIEVMETKPENPLDEVEI